MEYIVIRQPSPYLGKPINVVYYVVSRTQLAKCVDDYLNNVYEHTEEYAPIQVFKRLVRGKKGRMFKDAARHCRYLNNQIKGYAKDNKTASKSVETERRYSGSCSSMC